MGSSTSACATWARHPLAGMTIPFILFAAYQMTFAIITPALITGATADRLKFGGYAVFIGLWMVLVYAPVAHWVFAGGWLAQRGALDFAGGAVVHVNAGAAALAVVLVVGRRRELAPRGHAAPLAAADDARHRHPLVRLVRLQRRLGARGQRGGRPGRHEHHHRRVGGHARLAPDRAGSRTGTPRPSAPPRARSPDWWRSPRAPGYVEHPQRPAHRVRSRVGCASSPSRSSSASATTTPST